MTDKLNIRGESPSWGLRHQSLTAKLQSMELSCQHSDSTAPAAFDPHDCSRQSTVQAKTDLIDEILRSPGTGQAKPNDTSDSDLQKVTLSSNKSGPTSHSASSTTDNSSTAPDHSIDPACHKRLTEISEFIDQQALAFASDSTNHIVHLPDLPPSPTTDHSFAEHTFVEIAVASEFLANLYPFANCPDLSSTQPTPSGAKQPVFGTTIGNGQVVALLHLGRNMATARSLGFAAILIGISALAWSLTMSLMPNSNISKNPNVVQPALAFAKPIAKEEALPASLKRQSFATITGSLGLAPTVIQPARRSTAENRVTATSPQPQQPAPAKLAFGALPKHWPSNIITAVPKPAVHLRKMSPAPRQSLSSPHTDYWTAEKRAMALALARPAMNRTAPATKNRAVKLAQPANVKPTQPAKTPPLPAQKPLRNKAAATINRALQKSKRRALKRDKTKAHRRNPNKDAAARKIIRNGRLQPSNSTIEKRIPHKRANQQWYAEKHNRSSLGAKIQDNQKVPAQPGTFFKITKQPDWSPFHRMAVDGS